MAATDLSPFCAISRAEPAVSTALMVRRSWLAMNLRHWPRATESDWTALTSESVAPGHAEKVHAHGQVMLADDIEPAFGQDVVDVGDPAIERIFDRHDGIVGQPGLDRADGLLEGDAGHRLVVGKHCDGRSMAESTQFALKRDLAGHNRYFHSNCSAKFGAGT